MNYFSTPKLGFIVLCMLEVGITSRIFGIIAVQFSIRERKATIDSLNFMIKFEVSNEERH